MELEKFENGSSYEKLVSAYVTENKVEYHKQSIFFFKLILTKILRKN